MKKEQELDLNEEKEATNDLREEEVETKDLDGEENLDSKEEKAESEKENVKEVKDYKRSDEKKHSHDKKIDKKKYKKENTSYLKIFIIAIVCAIIIALLIVGILVLFKGKEVSQKERLEARLNELAKEFYEEKYYPNLVNPKTNEPMTDEEKKDFAVKFEQTGITMGLESLARTFGEEKDAILKEFVNEKTNKACDLNNTQVIVYPKQPYDSKSYDIKVILDCDLEEK